MEGGSSSALQSPQWIELPREVTENILSRLGPVDILKNTQRVCSTWRSVCKEPSLWRVIDVPSSDDDLMCRRLIDLSQGQLIDIKIKYLGSEELLNYISERSSRLKRLRLGCCLSMSSEALIASIKKFSELEELNLFYMPHIIAKDIEVISISCPKLKSFTFCQWFPHIEVDSYALSIAKNMHNLHHLCLFGNRLNNEELKAILNGCTHLESLDLRGCYSLDLCGEFGRICSERIKNLKRPCDSTDDYEWIETINDIYDSWNEDCWEQYEQWLPEA